MAYRKGGKIYQKAVGSRAEVKHGTAHHTSGGHTANKFKYNKSGRIVSVLLSNRMKRIGPARLRRAGYGLIKKGSTRIPRIGATRRLR